MLVCFVIDVNASMSVRRSINSAAQRVGGGDDASAGSAPSSAPVRGSGLSTLEWAKSAVEHFIKARQKANLKDQYLLLTTEKGPACIRSSWGDLPIRFDEQLRSLAPLTTNRSTDIGHALSTAFGLMNQYRLQHGVDNYGQGRCPWLIEPGCCLLLTDGENLRGGGGEEQQQQQHLHLTCPSQELTRDPFRWDQRFFPIVLHQQQHVHSSGGVSTSSASVFSPISVLRALAESTGGYYSMSDCLSGVNSRVDLILHRLTHVGTVVILAPDLMDQSTAGGGTAAAPPLRAVLGITQESAQAIWPIPEAFWLDRSLEHLPRRDAQPTLLYRRLAPDSGDPALTSIMVIEQLGLTMDRYPLEWCGPPLKMSRDARWPIYMVDSARVKGSRGEPFGYLEASELAGRTTLVLLPYNYPRLAELIKQAVDKGSALGNLTSLPVKWRPDFNQYLAQTPPYYYPSLRRCLKRVGLHSQVPEIKTGGLSQIVMKRLQRLRDTAREENQKIEASRNEHPNRREDLVCLPISVGFHASPSTSPSYQFDPHHQQQPQKELLLNLSSREELLPMWEGMRHRLFGERGLAVSGLYVKGFKSWRGTYRGNQARRKDMTLLCHVGAFQVPENPILEMGSYTETLLQAETMRDPTTEPDPDEDSSPEAVLQKRLAVNFGNPFRQGKGRGPGGGYGAAAAGFSNDAPGSGVGGGANGGGGGGGGGGVFAEADNEAAVLGPHSVLGDNLETTDGGLLLSSHASLVNREKREGDVGGGGGDVETDGEPARKRQKVNALPSLPFGKKLRRQQQSHHRPSSSLKSPAAGCGSGEKGEEAALLTSRKDEQQEGVSSFSPLTPLSSPLIISAEAAAAVVDPVDEEEGQEGEVKGDGDGPSTEEQQTIVEARKKEVHIEQPQPSTKKGPTSHHPPVATATKASKPSSSSLAVPASTISRGETREQQQQQQQAHQPAIVKPAPAHPPAALPLRPLEELLKDPSLKIPNQDGWMLAFSKREQRPYYFNTKTNKAVWQAPPGLPPINFEVPPSGSSGGGSEEEKNNSTSAHKA